MPTAYSPPDAPHGLFVGLTTVDIIFSFELFPQEDTKNTAQRYVAAAGGPATNAAVAFSHLGGKARLVSSLGKSGVADIARSDLAEFDLQHMDLTPDRVEPPALSAIAVAESNGSRTILTSPAIDDDVEGPLEADVVSSLLDGTDVVLIDGHQAEIAEVVVRAAKASGKTVVLDGDIYNSRVDHMLPMVDVAICSKSFAVPGVADTDDLFRFLAAHDVPSVAITQGAEPIELSHQGTRSRIEIEPIRAVDTLGAGDFFHGAFCYGMASGLDLHDALDLARQIAGQSVSSFGTREWMGAR